jgi:exosortase/archaeosortase
MVRVAVEAAAAAMGKNVKEIMITKSIGAKYTLMGLSYHVQGYKYFHSRIVPACTGIFPVATVNGGSGNVRAGIARKSRDPRNRKMQEKE